jgi:hypothetical protein
MLALPLYPTACERLATCRKNQKPKENKNGQEKIWQKGNSFVDDLGGGVPGVGKIDWHEALPRECLRGLLQLQK